MSRPDITGSLILEDRRIPAPGGRTVVMVVGLIAMPQDAADEFCKSRPHQIVVQGTAACGLLTLSHAAGMDLIAGMDPLSEEGQDAARQYLAYRVDQLLTSPIWRL
jgi:hypothetical protein